MTDRTPQNRMELLAPAGSPQALTAAVQSGADAVYLGFGDHNARRNAANFTREQFSEALTYCHIRGVKVYLTLNTLLTDEELAAAAEEIAFASAAGADAVLVQDLGVLSLARRIAPDLPVHASTQMSVMNLDGVRAAADLGCSRVVLARELPADQIAEICARSPIEVEVFVHGALCMSCSGQCFFSSVIGTRSGNRGLCAQPCRQLYGWGRKADAHLLSLKDLCLAGHLSRLEEMGVACLKIEGRMKRPEVVSVVTGIYAAALRERREPTAEERKRLEAAFSRDGFTDGYFTDCTGAAMFGSRPENAPEPQVLFSEARRFYETEHPRVGLTGGFDAQPEAPTALTLTDGTHTVTVRGAVPEVARNRALSADRAEEQLKKTGGTPYFISDLRVSVGENLSVPVSQLNALRRDALAELSALRAAPPERRTGNRRADDDDFGRRDDPPVPTVSLSRPEQLTDELLRRRPAVIYLPCDAAMQVRERIPSFSALGIEPSVILPRMLWDREVPELARQLECLKQAGVRSALVTNLGGAAVARRAGLLLRGDYGLAVANAASAAVYRDLGFCSLTPSFEQRLSRLREQNKPVPCELIAYGRLPLMITQNCLYKTRDGRCRKGCEAEEAITDRRGARFPVVRAYGCRNEILNSVPLWLADRRRELDRCGFWALRISFTVETPEECVRILDAYQSGDAPSGQFTRGLYFRDVD